MMSINKEENYESGDEEKKSILIQESISAIKKTSRAHSIYTRNLTASKSESNMRQSVPATINQYIPIMESYLFKYRPGFTQNYLDRYCVATQKYFLYYNKEWAAYSPSNKPVICLPFQHIKSVSKVKITDSTSQLHHFEIFIDKEYNLLSNTSWGVRLQQGTKADQLGDTFHKGLTGIYYSPDKLNTIAEKHIKVKKGHLMRSPEALLNSTIQIQNPESKEENVTLDGMKFTSKSQRLEFIKYAKSHKVKWTTGTLITENPKGWLTDFKGKQTWTNREIRWYMAESRMLFATPSGEMCNKWSNLLSWLIASNKSSV